MSPPPTLNKETEPTHSTTPTRFYSYAAMHKSHQSSPVPGWCGGVAPPILHDLGIGLHANDSFDVQSIVFFL